MSKILSKLAKVSSKVRSVVWNLTSPSYWMMNNRFDPVWDEKLNEALDKHDFTEIQDCTAQLGEYVVWIENHPYASMMLYAMVEKRTRRYIRSNGRPSRDTIWKAYQKLKQARNRSIRQ